MFPVASRIRNNSLMNHLSFHIYLVSVQESSVDGFDYESFQKELKKIRLPKQEFSFTLHKMKLSDDPSLSVSFYGALHTANVTYFDSNGIVSFLFLFSLSLFLFFFFFDYFFDFFFLCCLIKT